MLNAEPLVLLERPFDGCAVVTLNRPRALNALSLALRRELVAACDALAADAGLRVVVLTGAGRAFCAGLDLKELGAIDDPGRALSPDAAPNPVQALRRIGRPLIAAVNGPAITGGLELALACDILLASAQASFADTHVRVGVLPGWGLSQRLPRLIGAARAKELSFSGNTIGAEQAERWGLVNRLVDSSALLPQALQLAQDIARGAPAMLQAYRSLIDDGLQLPLAAALQLEQERSADWSRAIGSAQMAQAAAERLGPRS